jgi:Fe-S cluster assembly protein SufD
MNRADAEKAYRELSLPTLSDEGWRFTDLAGFDPDQYRPADKAGHLEIPVLFGVVELEGAARIDENGVTVVTEPDGILFESLPEDVSLIGELVGAGDKLGAHNAASWQGGLLVQVGDGVELERPLHLRIASTVAGAALITRLLVVAGRNSRFTLIVEHVSASDELDAYTNSAVELHLGEGARVGLVSLQNLARRTWHFADQRARIEQGAELDWVVAGFGSRKGKTRIRNDLVGAGASSRVTGVYFADGRQHLDFDTYQQHSAPETRSDFMFRGVLREQATAVWRGMIRVEPEAQRTDAYQENRNLLLSRTAQADSIPGLEILANDVRCSHGATVGQVDREQLFYLMSRGLTEPEAERLIVRGFFAQALDRVGREPLREVLGRALEARIT